MDIIHPDLRELCDDKSAHPICCRGGCCTARSPSKRVDFGVVDPWYFGEAGAVEEVVEEEHGRGDTAELGLLVLLK